MTYLFTFFDRDAKILYHTGLESSPNSVAVCQKTGDIIICDWKQGNVRVFCADLSLKKKVFDNSSATNDKQTAANGVAIDDEGLIYVAEEKNDQITVYKDYKPYGTIETMIGPCEMVIDGNRNLIVCESRNYCIQICRRDGTLVESYGSKGNGRYQFESHPLFMSISKDSSRIVISDRDGHVYLFGSYDEQNKKFKGGVSPFTKARGVAFDNDENIVVADAPEGRLVVITTDGELVRTIGEPGSGPGQLKWPRGIAFTPDGSKLVVCERDNHRIQIFQYNDLVAMT